MLDKKIHQNWIINKDFKILGGEGEGPPFAIFFHLFYLNSYFKFCPYFQLKFILRCFIKSSSESDNKRKFLNFSEGRKG